MKSSSGFPLSQMKLTLLTTALQRSSGQPSLPSQLVFCPSPLHSSPQAPGASLTRHPAFLEHAHLIATLAHLHLPFWLLRMFLPQIFSWLASDHWSLRANDTSTERRSLTPWYPTSTAPCSPITLLHSLYRTFHYLKLFYLYFYFILSLPKLWEQGTFVCLVFIPKSPTPGTRPCRRWSTVMPRAGLWPMSVECLSEKLQWLCFLGSQCWQHL